MKESLRCLISGMFDFGSTAQHGSDLSHAACDFERYRHGDECWLLNRFSCDIGALDELLIVLRNQIDESFERVGPWPLAVKGTAVDMFQADLATIEQFEKRAEGRAVVESFEVPTNGRSLAPGYLKALINAPLEEVFVELPWDGDMLDSITVLAETEVIGAKISTYQSDGRAPDPSIVAAFLQECINLDVLFKLSGGLKNPLCNQDDAGFSHGFLNVLIASNLANVHDLSRHEITRILCETDLESFSFTDEAASWRDFEVSTLEIEEFRGLISAIGSCSIEEPLQGLSRLRLV